MVAPLIGTASKQNTRLHTSTLRKRRPKMATWTMPGWTSEVNDERASVANQVADQNSCPTCDFSVSVKIARTNHAGSDRLPFLGELTSEKSYASLDEDSILDADPDNSYTPGGDALIPGISEVDLPKQTITADPLDLSLTDGDEPEPMQLSKPLETIPEDPDLEAQSAEHDKERDPEELSTHMEDEPAPLVFASLPFQDRELHMEPTREASEPRLQPLTQTVSESAVRAATSGTSVKEDKSTSTVDMVIVEEPPKSDLSPVEGKSSGVVIPFGFQRVGARSKTTEARMSSPVRGRRVTKFLEKFHMAEGGGQDRKALAQDTMLSYPLPEDIMSLEGVMKSGDKVKTEKFGELFTKHANISCDHNLRTVEDHEDDEVCQDYDHLPIRKRMDIWKKREHRAIQQGLILIPKLAKQGRFPISAWF